MSIKKRQTKTERHADHRLTEHILDLLAPWCGVDARRMFGGIGLFAFGHMFAIIVDDILYLKEPKDPQGKSIPTPFEKQYFEYNRQGKIVQLGYFRAPERALEEGSYLVELATASYQTALLTKKSKKSKNNPTNCGWRQADKLSLSSS
jgi:DNA transformation protein